MQIDSVAEVHSKTVENGEQSGATGMINKVKKTINSKQNDVKQLMNVDADANMTQTVERMYNERRQEEVQFEPAPDFSVEGVYLESSYS